MASFRSAADRLYRRLLRLYPGEFRADWGHEMTLLFRDRSREEPLPSLLFGVIVDTLKTAPREHYAMWSQDVRYALRMMARNPGFTAVAALSLALGTGAAASVFSLADALLLRPLSVSRPGELLALRAKAEGLPFGAAYSDFSWPDYLDYREKARSLDGLAAHRFTMVSLTPDAKSESQLRLGVLVSGNFFQVLGVEPALGRGFRPEEESVSDRSAVMVLSHALWTTVFGADPGVLGRVVRLNGTDFTVVGVAPERFTGVDQYVRPAFFAPIPAGVFLAGEPFWEGLEKRGSRNLNVKGRLASGVSLVTAEAELATIAKALEQAYPDTNKSRSVLLRSDLQARIESSPPNAALSGMLMGLVGLVLLIACANVANLLLSRAGARAREIALRQAVGAGRTRLVRQLLTEGLVLALLGGALGLVFAVVGVRFFASLPVPTDLPIVFGVQLDRRVLLFSLGASVLSVLAFGLAPALQTTRGDLVAALKVGDAGQGLARRLWGRQGLVAAQVALSLVLLVSAALLLRGFERTLAAGMGFRSDHLLMASFDPTVLRYGDEKIERLYRDLEARARELRGVRSAALTFGVPLGNQLDLVSFIPEGHSLPEGKLTESGFGTVVSDGYFDTMNVPILKGRVFARTDTKDAPRVAIVNEHLADTYWPGQDPLGKRLRLDGPDGPWAQVVGVAMTHKYLWPGEGATAFVYQPLAQAPRARMILLVESEGDPGALAAAVRGLARSLDPDLPVYNVRTMEDHYRIRAVAGPGMIVATVAGLGLMGLVLSLVGLYGLVAYSVSRRTREIGVRMALGAGRGQVLRMVLGQGLGLALLGVLAGLVLSAGVSAVLGSIVAGVDRMDPVVFLGLPVLLMGAATLAALVPASRAARVDPLRALRSE